jgi:hypothetical protein
VKKKSMIVHALMLTFCIWQTDALASDKKEQKREIVVTPTRMQRSASVGTGLNNLFKDYSRPEREARIIKLIQTSFRYQTAHHNYEEMLDMFSGPPSPEVGASDKD